ncbi:MAG: PD-(D/E)XK nuclease family protein [Fimbriimonadales bacterium]|nr:PD-(D/E)XK nuclease family protein [Fimbriimonadales bacterium]
MPRKPTLSPTRVTTYLACPVKYKWTYVDPRGKFFIRAKSYYSFGASLHAVLQRFHDEGDKGVETKEQALATLEETWLTAGYSSPEEAAEALAEGRELLSIYIDSFYERRPQAKTLFVEKPLRCDMGEFILAGRIDRLDEHPDGTLEIIDYKTGWSDLTPESISQDVALNCYQLLVRSLIPGRRVLTTLVVLRTQESLTVEPEEEELAQFSEDLKILGKEILNRDYEALVPYPKPLCRECDFLNLCLRHPEFQDSFQALTPSGTDAGEGETNAS